ncbi:unnamed protein product [Eruca vesicaria subsp. sativa]|uniref:Uncharacterized protein n=1 Tax=Eruca vesicaria subsp. sativa TaxID=29727 RepID=A0ABC8L807_ERUVS|nr:unnamed protein product [Eruca vesicaria subsp. sativa]
MDIRPTRRGASPSPAPKESSSPVASARSSGSRNEGLCLGKTNFFEKRVGDYQKASVMSSVNGGGAFDNHMLSLDEDF